MHLSRGVTRKDFPATEHDYLLYVHEDHGINVHEPLAAQIWVATTYVFIFPAHSIDLEGGGFGSV